MISNSYVIPVNASPQLELVEVGLNPITHIASEPIATQITILPIEQTLPGANPFTISNSEGVGETFLFSVRRE